jgi:hypothetical protein
MAALAPGTGNDGQTPLARSGDEAEARIADQGRTRIRDERDVATPVQLGQQPRRNACFVVVVIGDEPGRDPEVRQQTKRLTRILGGDQIDLAQHLKRTIVISPRLPIGVATTYSTPPSCCILPPGVSKRNGSCPRIASTTVPCPAPPTRVPDRVDCARRMCHQSGPRGDATAWPPSPESRLRQADALAAQGQEGAAAKAYLEIAKGTVDTARARATPIEGRSRLSVGRRYQQAQQLIGRISRPALTVGQREQLLLIEADLALSTDARRMRSRDSRPCRSKPCRRT